MSKPQYLDLEQAREVLNELGIKFNKRQMQRAAEMDAQGRRKLPFFIDPIDKKLKIDRNTLVTIYLNRQIAAENSAIHPNLD